MTLLSVEMSRFVAILFMLMVNQFFKSYIKILYLQQNICSYLPSDHGKMIAIMRRTLFRSHPLRSCKYCWQRGFPPQALISSKENCPKVSYQEHNIQKPLRVLNSQSQNYASALCRTKLGCKDESKKSSTSRVCSCGRIQRKKERHKLHKKLLCLKICFLQLLNTI